MVHCWMGFTDENGIEYTCLLDTGHNGLHCPTPDSEIEVEFTND